MTRPTLKRTDWSAADMEKWSARMESILASRFPDGPPPPVDWDAEEDRLQAEWRAEKADVLLSRLPGRMRDAVPRHDKSDRWLARHADGEKVNLVITGPARVGKTWEATAIVRALLLRYVPAMMIEVPELMDALRPNEDGASDIGQYQSTSVLVMDDLGAEKDSEWTKEQLFRVINFRHNRNLPTIITTNLTPDQVAARYGDRLAGRLFEDAMLLPIMERPADVPAWFEGEDQ